MELNCLYVNCNVLCIFWQIMNTCLLNLMHKIFKTCLFCLYSFSFSSWLASLVELDRSRGQLGPSPFCRLVCKTSQPEPSPFATSQLLARTEPSPSWLVSALATMACHGISVMVTLKATELHLVRCHASRAHDTSEDHACRCSRDYTEILG
jgi:hypothetical protein